jgi:hypothetical protein
VPNGYKREQSKFLPFNLKYGISNPKVGDMLKTRHQAIDSIYQAIFRRIDSCFKMQFLSSEFDCDHFKMIIKAI